MQEITITTLLKNTSYGVLFVASAQFLHFNVDGLIVLLGLMIIDVITGIVRSGILNGCPSIKSSIGTRGLLAKILTLTGIFSFALAGKSIGFDLNAEVSAIVNVFVLAEMYSILGNIYSALNKTPKNEADAVGWLLKLVRTALEKTLSTK